MLHAVDRNPGTSIWAFAVATERSQTTVHRVLQGEALYPFHLQRVQLLQPDVHPRRVVLLGFYILLPRLDSNKYRDSLLEVLPKLLTDVPAPVRHMLFQQNGHHLIKSYVRDHLDQAFQKGWIGRGVPIAWRPRSFYVSPLKFFLCGAMNSPVHSEIDLVAQMSIAAAIIHETFRYFQTCPPIRVASVACVYAWRWPQF
ncbi:hypothetical protein TNCV_940661 [Trichonephila clavipes]|nr:hypothetical protein TNCV_940661 [Trichonephila clavipes]